MKEQKGFSLIESLLALVVICLVGYACYTVFYREDSQAQNSFIESTENETGSVSELKINEEEFNSVNHPGEEENTPNSNTPTIEVPDNCDDYVHNSSGDVAQNYDQVKSGIIGKWIGCVSTPWVDDYRISMEFKEDGTYSAKQLSEVDIPALYYGTDEDHSSKIYSIDDFQESKNALGTIVVYWELGSNRTSPLSNIRLTGNTLSFTYFHGGKNGPVNYKLVRVNQ